VKESGFASRLNGLLAESGLQPLDPAVSARFGEYQALLLHWNHRINLTSIRDEETILKRHFVESIACACALPAGIRTLLDFGSGAGIPGIPIALCRPEIAVTLAESRSSKSAFLSEAVRVLDLSASVHAGRAELLNDRFDCVVLRAVDRMKDATAAASGLVAPGGWLAVLAGAADSHGLRSVAGAAFQWKETLLLPFSRARVLLLGRHNPAVD
jgi:16S rRNA (guanine527-N7)-methyltransferase